MKGLIFPISVTYNTLKNLRISLQGKTRKTVSRKYRKPWNRSHKKVFTEDIDMIELLLAHAIPEGIANISIPFAILVLMFVVDYRLALLSLVPILVGIFAMA